MKKEIFSISEKHERITISYRRTKKSLFAICDDYRKPLEWLTINEAVKLTGKDAEYIRQNLKNLREQNQTPKY